MISVFLDIQNLFSSVKHSIIFRFVYEDNVHDGYWLHLGISKSDPLENKRGELLNKLSLPMKGDFWITKADDPIDAKLIAFLRVFSMNEGPLYKTNYIVSPFTDFSF